MVWVQDYEDKWVNLDNWDFIDYITWEDKENNCQTFGFEFYVSKSNGEEHLLGFTGEKGNFPDDQIRLLMHGECIGLSSLNGVIHLNDGSFRQRSDESFIEYNYRSEKEIEKMIKEKRFARTE